MTHRDLGSSPVESHPVVVVGAGPAGVGVAASLAARGVEAVVLEKAEAVAPAWKRHYERLHLHTNKGASGLPLAPMPSSYPRYPSRDQVWEYVDRYARDFGVNVRFGTKVESVSKDDRHWVVPTAEAGGYKAQAVVIATGLSHTPRIPDYPGLPDFEGEVLHSADYLNGEPYSGETILVVGFGNSAGEIALDLMEHGADAHLSVRSPSVVVPRDILGIPILTIARWLSVFPPKVADLLSKPVLALTVGDVRKAGIEPAPIGPLEQIATKGKIPLLDIGTMAALRAGRITAHRGIARFTRSGVEFTDGESLQCAAVVFGTGYLPGVAAMLEGVDGVLDESGRPLVSGGRTSEPGLFFCGFHEPPTGRLREIGIEAERLADLIGSHVGTNPDAP